MKLSIIIPIYNTDINKLQRCFKSIKKIKSALYECILVDDGSMEKIATFLDEYARNTPTFKYLRQENRGVSSARNYGIDNACGDYICFVDSDDEIEPIVYDFFLNTEYNSDIIFSDMVFIDRDRNIRWSVCNTKEITYEKIIKIIIVDGKINGPCCKFIRRNFLNWFEIKFREEMVVAEDLVFLLDMMIKKPSISYCNEISYYYHWEEKSGIERLKNNLTKFYFNYREVFFMEINCICSGKFDSMEMENLKCWSERKYIKSLFNTTIELVEAGMNRYNIENDLEKVMETINIKDRNLLTKIRKKLMFEKHWSTLRILALARRNYLRAKRMFKI